MGVKNLKCRVFGAFTKTKMTHFTELDFSTFRSFDS